MPALAAIAVGLVAAPALGFTFAPDGNPVVGPIRGLRNYWVAVGVMAGFSQGGGVGLAAVADLARSLAFYETVLAPLGYAPVMDVTKEQTGGYEGARMLVAGNPQLPAGQVSFAGSTPLGSATSDHIAACSGLRNFCSTTCIRNDCSGA